MTLELIVLSLLFILGTCIGSFTNVLIDRIPYNTFFSNRRSYCESCKKTLKWYDLLPLISFILLRGKCRFCKKKISKRIFLVELLMGVGFVLIYITSPAMNVLVLISLLMIYTLFVSIFFIDAQHRIIPDSLLVFLLFTILLYHLVQNNFLFTYFLTGLGSFLFFFLLYFITRKKGIGFGDVKFAFVIGFLLGFPPALVAFYGAFLTGAIVSIILIIIGRKRMYGSVIAFGPFLIIGVLIAALYSDEIIKLLF